MFSDFRGLNPRGCERGSPQDCGGGDDWDVNLQQHTIPGGWSGSCYFGSMVLHATATGDEANAVVFVIVVMQRCGVTEVPACV